MGVPNIRIFSGVNNHQGFTRDRVFEWMAKNVKECCNYGEKHEVIIAIQYHNNFMVVE